MNAIVYLPEGAKLAFEKGVDGVDKLFTDDNGALVVVTASEVKKYANMPIITHFDRGE